jgi:DNA-binding NarL/FixJ family response regulator
LIVDDDDLATLALAALLEQSGIDVERVCTAAEARRARDCSVLVCELRLTGQTAAEGKALLAELHRLRSGAPIVVFSSFLRAGGIAPVHADITAAAWIPKATLLGRVVTTIRALLDGAAQPLIGGSDEAVLPCDG